jgi:hypothetical protein
MKNGYELVDGWAVADSEESWQALLADPEARTIRTLEDWRRVLESTDNPLVDCPNDVVERFTDSLMFANGGLAHAEYEDLIDLLTVRKFRRLWELFGLHWLVFKDYDCHRCDGQHNCVKVECNVVCTSNC